MQPTFLVFFFLLSATSEAKLCFSTQGVSRVQSGYPCLSALRPGNSFKAVSQSNYRVYLLCFLISEIAVLPCLMSSVSKTIVLCILSGFLFVPNGKVKPISVTPSWWKVEVFIDFFLLLRRNYSFASEETETLAMFNNFLSFTTYHGNKS